MNAAPPDHASLASLRDPLRLAIERHRHGWHRLLVAPSPDDAERVVRALATELGARAYAIDLAPWLFQSPGVIDVLQPYRHLSRTCAAPTMALVRDTPALFDPARAIWRTDPFASRLMRRSLISSSLPTFWWVRDTSAAGLELSVLAPVCICAANTATRENCSDHGGEFIVRALEL